MRFITLCLLVCGAIPLQAQTPKIRKVNCRFLCLAGATPPEKLISPGENGGEVSCEVPANSFSPNIDCFANENIISFLSSSDHKPVATATIPANVNAAILVFVPAQKSSDVVLWKVFVIEDSTPNFPDGGAFVANFYSQDIRFVIGENKTILHSGTSYRFSRPAKRDDFNMAPVVFEFQQDQTWRTSSESLLRFLPGMRYLIIAYVDPNSGRPRISTHQDFRVRH